MTLQDFLAKHPKRHLIFDLDMTLGKLLIDWTNFREEFFDLVGRYDPEVVKQVPNQHRMGNILYSLAIKKNGEKLRQALLKHCHEWESSRYQGIIPNKPLIELIKANRGNLHFYLWSSNNRSTVDRALQDLGLSGVFEKTISKEEVTLLKPYPDGFGLIFNSQTQERSDYLMVGDNEQDKEAAKAAGIDYYQVVHDWSQR